VPVVNNEPVPFTLSHAAAALPFRRTRLVPSALLIGTFAPDLEYFIRLQAGGGWGHALSGVFALDLPVALVTLWIFHRLVKVPLVYLLPDSVRARLTRQLVPFRFGPTLRFLNVALSMLIGIATHLVLDGFTHENYWISRHMKFLSTPMHLPIVGWTSLNSQLQDLLSVGGILLLAVWCYYWYRRTRPDSHIPANPFTPRHRHVIVAIGVTVATVVSVLRAWLGTDAPIISSLKSDLGISQMVVTFGALVWWQLALWGLLGPFRHTHRVTSEEETYMESRASLGD
jgi:hypothetical protein